MTAFSGLLFAPVDVSAFGDNEVVAAAPHHRIKVISYVLVVAGNVAVTWKSGSTDISGPMPFAANGGAAASSDPQVPFFQTEVNEALNLALGGAVQVSGHITYVKEPY